MANTKITSGVIADDAVLTANITDANVTTAKIAADAVTSAKVADDAINSEHLAADSIDAEHYAAGSVDATAIASNAVTTAKINDDAVTTAKIADAQITTALMADDSITAAKLANDIAISTTGNLTISSSGQAILKVEGVNQYYVGMMIRNNYSSTQSQWHVAAAGGTSGWGAANGNFIIRDDTTNSTAFEAERGAGGASGALYIDSDGKVGVGTASPDTMLHINGAANSEQVIITGNGNSGRGLSIQTAASGGQQDAGVHFEAQDTEAGANPYILHRLAGANYSLLNGTGNTVAYDMFADSGSNEGVFKLKFYSDGASAGQEMANITMQQGSGDGGSRKAEMLFQVSDNGAPATAMTIANNKNVKIFGSQLTFPNGLGASSGNSDVNYNTSTGLITYRSSSKRYKKDIIDLDIDTTKIYDLRTVRYTDRATDERCFGLIAEEVNEVIPELVNKKVVEGMGDEPVPDNITYSTLSVLLLKELQSTKTKLDDALERIKTLEDA
jgi:hypothetical protein